MLYLVFDKIAKPLILIFQQLINSIIIKLNYNNNCVLDNEVDRNIDNKVYKIDKILAESKFVKIVIGQKICKTKHLQQLIFQSSKASNIFFIKDDLN